MLYIRIVFSHPFLFFFWLFRGTSDTHTEMEARKPIICGLSARGIIPPLPREETDDDVEDIPPTEAEVVEISDEEEDDIVELSNDEYRRSMGYLIRVEEEEDDIAPEFSRMVQMMHEEEKKAVRGEVQGVEGWNQARRRTILYG